MAEKSKQVIELQINRLKNLPALPEASLRILEAINDPDIAIDKLAEVLTLSPGLVARLLGLANSAYFGQSGSVTDLRAAIFQVLGLELVKSLSLGIVLNVQFDTGKCRAFDTEYFWMRSLLTALAAQKLAGNALSQFPPATVYTSGLLADIGVLVLGYLIPEEMNAILQLSESKRTSASDEIRSRLEISHYQLGYILLRKWQLSSIYQSVLNHFEDAEFGGEEKPLIDLLKVSRRLSAMLLDGEAEDIHQLENLCEELSISTAGLPAIVDELVEKREGIQKLAAIMGN